VDDTQGQQPAENAKGPPMWEWYTRYYGAVHTSQANARYCQQLNGRNLYQHDFTEMAHLDRLIEITGMRAGQRVLDLGCGNGWIAEYLSDQTGAKVSGLEMIPEAVRQAQERTIGKCERLDFRTGDIARLDFPRETFDILVSIDTLYFTDLPATIAQMKAILKPGGCMGIFYSYGCLPWENLEEFDRQAILPYRTPLARALAENGLACEAWDYTQEDYAHARRKKQIAEDLKAEFESEGNLFLYENHAGEAAGVMWSIEHGVHGRHLYLVKNEP